MTNARPTPTAVIASRTAAAGLTFALTVAHGGLALIGARAVRRPQSPRPCAECLADHRRRRHHHNRLAGRRDWPRLLDVAAANPGRRARRRLEQGETGAAAGLGRKKYGNPEYDGYVQTTSSFAVRGYFKPMRVAGAQARRVLIDAVAAKWGVPAGELTTEPNVVVHKAPAAGSATARSPRSPMSPAELPKIEEKDLKPAASFRLIGKDFARVDVPLKVRGAAKYAMDAQVPGMVYAAVLQSPYQGGAPQKVDDAKARGRSGHHRHGEVAGRRRRYRHQRSRRHRRRNSPEGHLERCAGARARQREGARRVRGDSPRQEPRGRRVRKRGDARAAMRGAAKVMRGEFRTRYVLSRPDGADERDRRGRRRRQVGRDLGRHPGTDGLSTRSPGSSRPRAATSQCISICSAAVTAGAASRKWSYDAVRLAKAVGKPVKLIWSREDDMRGGKFRPMTAQHIEAGFDANGKIVAWHHRVVAESVAAIHRSPAASRRRRPTEIVMKGTPIPQYGSLTSCAEHVVELRGARLAALRGVGNAPTPSPSRASLTRSRRPPARIRCVPA